MLARSLLVASGGRFMSPFIKINGEIRACLDRIESGRPAIAQLAVTLDRLRSDPAWSAREIREVEVGVRHILSKIVVAEKKGRESHGQQSSPVPVSFTDTLGRRRPVRDPMRLHRSPGRDRKGPEGDPR
jgi:hypothetical protein